MENPLRCWLLLVLGLWLLWLLGSFGYCVVPWPVARRKALLFLWLAVAASWAVLHFWDGPSPLSPVGLGCPCWCCCLVGWLEHPTLGSRSLRGPREALPKFSRWIQASTANCPSPPVAPVAPAVAACGCCTGSRPLLLHLVVTDCFHCCCIAVVSPFGCLEWLSLALYWVYLVVQWVWKTH